MSTKKELMLNDVNEANGIRFSFDNGEVFEADIDALPEAMIHRLAVHGLSQKLGDSYAGAKGKGMTDDDIAQGVRDLYAALKAGSFGTGRTSTGGKLLDAFIRWAADAGKKADEAREAFNALDDDAKKELRKAAPIKAKLAEIEAERAEALARAVSDDDDDLTAKYF
jgi:hypothetical protein